MFVWTPDMIRFMQAANEKATITRALPPFSRPSSPAAARSATRGAGWERYPPR